MAATLTDGAILKDLLAANGMQLDRSLRSDALSAAALAGCPDNLKMLLGSTEEESARSLSTSVPYQRKDQPQRIGTLLHLVIAELLPMQIDSPKAQALLSVLRFLLARESLNVNETDSSGSNVMHVAAECLGNGWVRQGGPETSPGVRAFNLLLTRNDLDVNALDSDGYTALQIATRRSHSTAVGALLSRPDLDVNFKNDAGDTALHIAVRRMNAERSWVFPHLCNVRFGRNALSAYEVAHWLLMDDRTDRLQENSDNLTASELLEAEGEYLPTELFQNHGRHCHKNFKTRIQYFTDSYSFPLEELINCALKYKLR